MSGSLSASCFCSSALKLRSSLKEQPSEMMRAALTGFMEGKDVSMTSEGDGFSSRARGAATLLGGA